VGLIGVPVLAGSAGYALSEAMGWTSGLERTVKDARGFYGIIAISMALGFALHFSSISPMKALFWSAVINGLVAVPLMAVIVLLVSKSSVMGPFTASRSLVVLGWLATGVMGIAALGMFIPS
jgi:Mn2+/Fe2+ NRAMP family transporter